MSKYAIVKLAGKQYKVQEKDKFIVDRLSQEPGKTFTNKKVLLYKEDDQIEIGAPVLKNKSVKLKVLEDFKDKKIRVAKYKAKSRYRRVKGHRQLKSLVEVVSIN